MSLSGTSLVPLVLQVKQTQLFQVSNATYLSPIIDVFYSENHITQAQCFILIISDGTYLIPVLVNSESIKEQFRLTTLNSTTLNNLRYKVITIRRSAVSVYRRDNHVSPYIIALDWQKSIDQNITVPLDIQCISRNPKVTQWIKVFRAFGLSKDKPISSFFQIPHIDRLFPSFAQVEYILEKTMACCFVKGEWVANRAMSKWAVVKEETIGTEKPADTARSIDIDQEPMNAEEQMDTDESVKTKPFRTKYVKAMSVKTMPAKTKPVQTEDVQTKDDKLKVVQRMSAKTIPVKTKQPIRTDQTLHTQRPQHTASSNIIYLDEMDEVEESDKSVSTSNVSALNTNNIKSGGTVINDPQTTSPNMNQTDKTIVISSSESNSIETIENVDIIPSKRTIPPTTFDVPEKKAKTDHVQCVQLTDLSKEELKKELTHHVNELYSIANDKHISTFGKISALSNLRSLCYIRHLCDS
ncbi:hypothetical protein EDC94DRAFT_629031 [Helicostylum pulchrum]|nr:hypothetical protein EDC94DRAFT_629031 [Helicostylum pulchrum]